MTPFFAFCFRQLALDIVQVQNSTFGSGTASEHQMLQLWIKNALGTDAISTRFACRWERVSSMYQVQSVNGLWAFGRGSGMGNYEIGLQEDADLLSNGNEQHAALAVKYSGDVHAYLICPTLLEVKAKQNTWRYPSPSLMLGAGVYNVDVILRARGGRTSLVRLKVQNPGSDGPLSCEITSHRSLPYIK